MSTNPRGNCDSIMKKILLVNNQDAFLDRNKCLLNRAGFLILTAASAKQALQICREQTVDLIIALLDMPETGGDLLCAQIRRDDELKNVAIILVCYAYQAELSRASLCGANAVVTKPVRPERLLELVGKFLETPARREYRAVFNARVAGTRESLAFSGLTRNISSAGILCESATALKPDDLLSNLLFAVNAHRVVAEGKVVWAESIACGRYQYGVQFTVLPRLSRESIEAFVAAPEQDRLTG